VAGFLESEVAVDRASTTNALEAHRKEDSHEPCCHRSGRQGVADLHPATEWGDLGGAEGPDSETYRAGLDMAGEPTLERRHGEANIGADRLMLHLDQHAAIAGVRDAASRKTGAPCSWCGEIGASLVLEPSRDLVEPAVRAEPQEEVDLELLADHVHLWRRKAAVTADDDGHPRPLLALAASVEDLG
jgi:hypothetical protein